MEVEDNTTRGYFKSQACDISTIGIVGVVNMVHSNPNQTKQLQFGITISQGLYPYTNTTVVTIVPRYVLINKLEHPLLVKQYMDSHVKENLPYFLSNE